MLLLVTDHTRLDRCRSGTGPRGDRAVTTCELVEQPSRSVRNGAEGRRTDIQDRAFVSYAGEDVERFVTPFASGIWARGVDAWVAFWEMLPGDSLPRKIFNEGLDPADTVIIVLSRFSFTKRLGAGGVGERRRATPRRHRVAVRPSPAVAACPWGGFGAWRSAVGALCASDESALPTFRRSRMGWSRLPRSPGEVARQGASRSSSATLR